MTKQKGFTLIEVLIALVILSLAFAANITSISETASGLKHVEEKTIANWVASNVMARAQLDLLGLQSNATIRSGNETMLDRTLFWNLTLKPTPNPFIHKINLFIKDGKNGPVLLERIGYLKIKAQQ